MLECFVFTRISKISLLMHPSSINRLKRNIYLGLLKFFGGNAYSNAKELTYSMLTHLFRLLLKGNCMHVIGQDKQFISIIFATISETETTTISNKSV